MPDADHSQTASGGLGKRSPLHRGTTLVYERPHRRARNPGRAADRELAATLEAHAECLKLEREFFEAVRKISEDKIEELLEWEAKL